MVDKTLIKKAFRTVKYLIAGKPHERSRALQEISYRLANIFGDFPFSESYQLWREDKEFLKSYKHFYPYNNFSQDRKFILKEFGRFVSSFEGDIAECGSYQGASAYYLAKTNPKTTIHCIDSFEGLSSPSQDDIVNSPEHRPWQTGDLSSPLEVITKNLANFTNVKIYKGWIPDVFADLTERKYKLVHIDVDLYEPTKASVEYFFPRMISGGIMILDDYGSLLCPGAKKAADEYFDRIGLPVLLFPSGQGLVINHPKTNS